jgi:glycine/D-amino acid oxidase-like deaminating enzyme
MKSTAEVVVVGGGVIGAAILHELATHGIKNSILLEKGYFAGGSTGYSGGILRIYHPDTFLSDLAAESFETYLRFEEEMGETCRYTQTGLLYFEPESRTPKVIKEIERLNGNGYQLEIIKSTKEKKRFPTINWEGIGTAIYEPSAGFADPVLATRAWIRKARELGAMACEGIQVKEVLVEKNRVVGVNTNVGVIHSPLIIMAAGAWSTALLANLDISLPVRSKCIQVFFLDRQKKIEQHPSFIDDTTGLYGRPESQKLSLIGYPIDEWDINPDLIQTIDLKGFETLQEISEKRLSWFQKALLSGGRRSFDGYTPDNRGILKYSSRIDGLLIATGWSGGGFKMAPGIARRVINLILQNQ